MNLVPASRRVVLCALGILIAVPASAAPKDDWTEVDHLLGHQQIAIWLFKDHAEGQRKFTGTFAWVSPATITLDADKPRNKITIEKRSIKRIAVRRRSSNKAWHIVSFGSLGLLFLPVGGTAKVVLSFVPSGLLLFGPSGPGHRTIYQNTGKPPLRSPNDGSAVRLTISDPTLTRR